MDEALDASRMQKAGYSTDRIVLIVGFFVLSLVAGHRLSAGAYGDPRAASRALVPMAALSCVFTLAAIVLLNLPMGMRHGM